jgi:hypothetical protein
VQHELNQRQMVWAGLVAGDKWCKKVEANNQENTRQIWRLKASEPFLKIGWVRRGRVPGAAKRIWKNESRDHKERRHSHLPEVDNIKEGTVTKGGNTEVVKHHHKGRDAPKTLDRIYPASYIRHGIGAGADGHPERRTKFFAFQDRRTLFCNSPSWSVIMSYGVRKLH